MPSGHLRETRATTSTGANGCPPHAAAAEVRHWQIAVRRWGGTVACEERRQLLRMDYTAAAGERCYDTSG
jgi:hypothetical protein